ncbi:hypothetical protein M501DRAFT_233762 [Patellaria atrata CBS 101060]|uniref:C3H1-type domain-containing protein n=1 Tax=Patellaria atrata CBS 101060 TaxID=1346257 RepID=A0A9P4S7U1_9PEZI|nr:hypothetical protein M501DRAFT_233762 [Patellaria atrata CBS 101060]
MHPRVNFNHPSRVQANWRERAEPVVDNPTVDSHTAGSNTGAHPQLPKDFPIPITCFYWMYAGGCIKTDDECYYAHRDTGLHASAPFSDGQRKSLVHKNSPFTVHELRKLSANVSIEVIAGRRLHEYLASVARHGAELEEARELLRVRERDLDEREARLAAIEQNDQDDAVHLSQVCSSFLSQSFCYVVNRF